MPASRWNRTTRVAGLLPGLDSLRAYERGWLVHDLFAGLTLTAMLVPVGIAYAVASGVAGVNGLYATIAALLAYAIFGPSRILVLGPDSSLAAVILGVTSTLGAADPDRATSLAAAMALVCGVVCVAGGVAGLGFLTDLLSKPIRYGYMNGIAFTVIATQLPKIIGVNAGSPSPMLNVWASFHAIAWGGANRVEAALGVGTLLAILAARRWGSSQGVFASLFVATAIAWQFDLAGRVGISVLGPLPKSLPTVSLPHVQLEDLNAIVVAGCAAAIVAAADTSVLSRVYAEKTHRPVGANQEIIALGAANLAVGFFQGFPVSSSSSRTPVAEAAGARTQLTGVFGAVFVAILLYSAPNLLAHLPTTALAAVVIASAIGLLEVADLARIYRIQRWEFWLSIVCFAGVVLFGAVEGIGVAVVIAVIEFLWDGWRPHYAVLGSVEGVRGFHDVTRYPDARRTPGVVLFRWDAPLFFANAEYFRERALEAISASPNRVWWLVIAAEPITSVDVTAADMLSDLNRTLQARGMALCFAELKDPVKDKLKRFGLFSQIGEGRFFATVGAAVAAYGQSRALAGQPDLE